jgi:hypothetical protein
MWLDLAVNVLVSLTSCALFYAGLARVVWNLQCDLSATQAQLLRERNQRASLARSKDKEALEVLSDLQRTTPPLNKVNPLAKFQSQRG